MAATRHPLIDLVYNDETGRYIGHLERKLLKLTLDDMKMRALLELLTGDMWDNTDFSQVENAEIQRLAVDTLKRRLNLSEHDARKMVAERWERLNPPAKDGADSTIFAGPNPNEPVPHVVTTSRPIGFVPAYDHQAHLNGLEYAAQRRNETRDQL